MRARIIGLLLAASAAMFGFQTDPKSKASIEGRVVNQATGAPLENATIKLRRLSYIQDPLVRQTNEEGRFNFTNLLPGDWELSAERRGFLPGSGARRYVQQDSRISLKADQQIKDLVLRLVPQAVISGRVLDVQGEPVEGARVAALKAGYANGVLRWSEMASTTTLDNGEYRIPRVPAGRYLVRCTMARIERTPSSSNIETAYAATYYPNVTEQSSAAPVEVQDGSEVVGIEVRLATTRAFHVRGKSLPPTDRQSEVPVVLVERSDPLKAFASTSAQPPNYLFDFPRVPPGSYIAFAWSERSGTMSIAGKNFASQPVEVGGQDIDNLVLIPALAGDIVGSVKLKPNRREVDLRNLWIEIRPITFAAGIQFSPEQLSLAAGIEFSPFQYRIPPYQFAGFAVRVSHFPEGCYLASVRYGGRDVPDSGIEFSNGAALEITIGADGAQVDGSTLDKDDTPSEGAVVVLIPADGKNAARSMLSGPRGSFHFTGVPPGDYKLTAWDDIARDDLENPALIKRFESQTTSVKLTSSGTANVSIKVISPEPAR